MGILVTSKDTFSITSQYRELPNGAIEIVDPIREMQEAEELKKENKEVPAKPDVKSVTVTCRRPDFSTSQTFLAMAGRAGTENFDLFRVKNALLFHLTVGWDVKTEDGKDVPASQENLASLRIEVAKDLSSKIEEFLGGINAILPIF